jgi:hypothetical protein
MDYMAAQMDNQIEGAISENERLRQEIERLQAIEAAARNLVKVKGRYHTEQAFKALVAALETTEQER